MRYKCVSAISALASFHFSECLLFYPSCLLYGEDFFQAFRSMANKRYKMVCHQIHVRGNNFFLAKKKEQEIRHSTDA